MNKIFTLILLLFSKFSFSQWVTKDISSVTTKQIYVIYFTDSLHGWFGGYQGAMINTKDGGFTWEVQDSMTPYQITAIFFLDNLKGWAGSENGRFLSTNDGGDTWSSQSLTGTICFLQFSDSLNGLMATRPGIIYTTHDGGNTWLQTGLTSPVGFKDIYVLDSIHAWGVGNGYIYKFDGVWNQVFSNGSADFYSVHFTDSLHGWTVGINEDIRKTVDGGNNWIVEHTGTGPYLLSVFMLDTLNGWAAGDFGRIYRYNGSTWTQQSNTLAQALQCVYFPDINHGWAGSFGGKLATTDLTTSIVKVNFSDYKIFPNPSNEEINFRLNYPQRISIRDEYGRVCLTEYFSYSNDVIKLDISFLSDGIYFLDINGAISKFIKMRL